MYLGDNLLRDGITELVEHLPLGVARRPDPAHPGARPRALRRGRARQDGRVARLVEKPPEPKTDLALVGVYMFTPAIFEAARAIEPSRPRRARDHRRDPVAGGRRQPRGPAPRPRLVEGHRPGPGHARGQPADPRRPRGARGGRADRLARGGPRGDRAGRAARALHRARARRSSGPGRSISDAYIGPYTAIGDDVTIDRAELEHSIVLAGLHHPRPRVPDRGEPDRPQREDRPRPVAAQGLPLRRGRQRRDLDPLSASVRRRLAASRHALRQADDRLLGSIPARSTKRSNAF